MQLKSKTTSIELSDSYELNTENKFDITYRYALSEGALIGQIEAQVTKDGRQIMSKSTTDGEQFHGSLWEQAGDELGNLNELINQGMQSILADPISFIE